jgi:hypothetical protein
MKLSAKPFWYYQVEYQRTLFVYELGRWKYWWETKKEIERIVESDLSTSGFIH